MLLSVFLSCRQAIALSLISDEETEIFLHQTLRPVFKAAGVAFYPGQIYVVNDKTLNAFVTDGNRMFVNIGTIIAADSQNELTGVLAHETGHIQGGHILRHKIKAREVQSVSLASMLVGGLAGIAAGRADLSIAAILGSQSSALNSMLSYQISEERSADEAAVNLLEKIGQSPAGMLRFLQKIKQRNKTQGIAEREYFRTHPLTDERIETDSTYDAGTTTQLMWGARSDVGCVRPHNEDSYLVQSPLFCVCDGMGGHAAGEVASSIAVETIAKTAPQSADAARLAAAVEAANAAVIEAALNGLGKPGMGCTATCAYIENDTLAIAHVGDSRAYLLHEGTLIRVTRDHSYVEELVDAGEITADEARVHPNRSVITRALGSDPAMYADHFTLHIEEGDRLILCSDGLSSMIPDSDIENIATQSSTAQICVDNLVDAALAAGGHDNVTVVVVDLVDDGVVREAKRLRRRNVTIAAVLALVFVLVAGIWAYTGVTGSYYLGTYHGNVAVWRGLPGKTLGVELHWLESETSIKLSDLPEDTQNRLKAGIPQTSVDDAQDTISKYRHQIDEEQTRQVIDAQTIRDNTDQKSTSESDSEKTAEQSAEAEASDKN